MNLFLETLIGGLLAGGISMEKHLMASDLAAERRALLEGKYGIGTTADNAEAVRGADVVVLAIKPQQVAEALAAVLEEIRGMKQIIFQDTGHMTTKKNRKRIRTFPVNGNPLR